MMYNRVIDWTEVYHMIVLMVRWFSVCSSSASLWLLSVVKMGNHLAIYHFLCRRTSGISSQLGDKHIYICSGCLTIKMIACVAGSEKWSPGDANQWPPRSEVHTTLNFHSSYSVLHWLIVSCTQSCGSGYLTCPFFFTHGQNSSRTINNDCKPKQN